MKAHRLKRLAVGRPLRTGRLRTTLLSKWLALPIFSSDTLSSVAYATEASLTILIAASLASRELVVPISAAVAVLLVLVVLSYRQTVQAYPGGGGAYVVASQNLGRLPGLLAAASLLIDYVLTVAVSIAAGVLALTSASEDLQPLRVELALAFLVALAVANMRGVREAGRLFAVPTYGFVAALLVMIAVGLGRCAAGACPQASVPSPEAAGTATAASLIVVLRAFASGASALTGVEAIANGVRAFREPQARNAAQTLAIMGALAVVLFMGVSVLAYETGARPSAGVSVLSEVARAVFPSGSISAAGFVVVQVFTFAILVLAANTAFQGFPRLAAILARDRYLPTGFANLGDRLVYSNGMAVLGLAAALLLVVFQANVQDLLHLWLLGVFTAFTLSQVGMLRHWHVARGQATRRRSMAFNALGAIGTAGVAVLVLITKFTQGVWIVVLAIPLVLVALVVHRRHDRRLDRLLHRHAEAPDEALETIVVVYIEDQDAAAEQALAYARRLDPADVRVIHADGGPAEVEARRLARLAPDGIVNVVIPELFATRSLWSAARLTSAALLESRLADEPKVVVTHVGLLASGPPPAAPTSVEALVLLPEVDDAALHALAFARSLGADRTRAVYVALDPESGEQARRSWDALAAPEPIEIVDAPFRTLEGPALETVREITARPGTMATVVVPEIATGQWWQDLLYNERALYLAWLLRFEPRVVLTGVRLGR